MWRFVLKRVLKGVFYIWCIWSLVFLLFRVTGDPISVMFPEGATEYQLEATMKLFHLDEPLWKQYLLSFQDLLHGEMGDSFFYRRPVTELFAERLGTTVKLSAIVLTVFVIIGVSLGVFAAVNHRKPADRIIMFCAIVLNTIPDFCFGIILILVFSLFLGILPSSGSKTWMHFILPACTIGVGTMAGQARLTRSSLLTVLNKEYINGARMKGVKEPAVIIRHGLRNSLIPVVTSLAASLGTIIGGAVVTETIFSMPGMGALLVTAAKNSDYPIMQYGVLLIATSVNIMNIVVDIAYGWLDPRIRENFK